MDKFLKKDKICAPHVNNKNKTCFSRESLIKIAKSLDIIKNNKTRLRTKTLWEKIRNKLSNKCNNDETCWIDKIDEVKKIKDPNIHLFTFKPKKPKEWFENKHTWLDTNNIYHVMIQAEKLHNDFVFFGPVPSDCPTDIQCELSGLEPKKLKKEGINKVGIVFNLDVSTGPGTHWVATYIDVNRGEIDYFDSYGGKPIPLINKFIQKMAKKFSKENIEPKLIYNDKRHQYGHSECGMFSMYFILKRHTGDEMYKLVKEKITDKKMNDLRSIFYRE